MRRESGCESQWWKMGGTRRGPTLFKFLILVEMVSAEGIEPSTY
jgi:hypothetical protein